jgi:hypothetical protein
MKKTLLALSVALIGFGANAQETKLQKRHSPYISAGMNWAPKSANSASFEAGTWGMSANTSFGVTYDFVPTSFTYANGASVNIGQYTAQWLGVKAYWTVHSEDKLCYMLYMSPKVCVHNMKNEDGSYSSSKELLEFGFNPNYTITKNILLGVTVGNQYLGSDSPLNLFASGGFIFLIY